MDVVGGIGNAIKLAVKAKELADQLKNLEMKAVIVDLQGELLDLKEQVLELRTENVQLKEEAAKRLAPPELVVKNNLYYKPNGEGPFCTGCQDTRGQLVRLTEYEKRLQRLAGKWHCPSCKTSFTGK